MSFTCSTIKTPTLSQMKMLLGVFARIDLFHKDPKFNQCVVNKTFEMLRRLDFRLSRFMLKSEVSQINAQAYKREVTLQEDLYILLKQCKQFWRKSNGWFDIAMAPLIDQHKKDAHIQVIPQSIGMKYVQLNDHAQTVRFTEPGVALDLSAVSRGYALDCVHKLWQYLGVNDAMINVGSHILAKHPQVEHYGIVHPSKPRKILGIVPIKKGFLASNSRTQMGVHSGYIFNPKTGAMSRPKCLGTAVSARSGLFADMAATALYASDCQESGFLEAYSHGQVCYRLDSSKWLLKPQLQAVDQ